MIGSSVTATGRASFDNPDKGTGVIVATRDQFAARFSNTARATGAAEKAFGHPA